MFPFPNINLGGSSKQDPLIHVNSANATFSPQNEQQWVTR